MFLKNWASCLVLNINSQLPFYVRYSDHGLNTRPFNDRTGFNHLNTGLVRYSDPHCILKEMYRKTQERYSLPIWIQLNTTFMWWSWRHCSFLYQSVGSNHRCSQRGKISRLTPKVPWWQQKIRNRNRHCHFLQCHHCLFKYTYDLFRLKFILISQKVFPTLQIFVWLFLGSVETEVNDGSRCQWRYTAIVLAAIKHTKAVTTTTSVWWQ